LIHENRCVEATDAAANEVGHSLRLRKTLTTCKSWMFNDELKLFITWERSYVDMAKAFAGKMSHDDFFIKYSNITLT
jgi:hypothetical protein